MGALRIIGRYALRCLTAVWAMKNRVRANALHGFSPPQFGQGSLLRNALLSAQTVSYLECCVPYLNFSKILEIV